MNLFKLREHKTDIRTEITAGFTTFMAMLYIVPVNASIMSASGMPYDALITATAVGHQPWNQVWTKCSGSAASSIGSLQNNFLKMRIPWMPHSTMLTIIWVVLFAILIKLILKPLIVWVPTLTMDLQDWQLQVLILEAAMPSALLTVVFAKTYGCDAKLASKLIFATLVASSITIIVMFGVLTGG